MLDAVTIVIPVKNEEKNLAVCLEHLKTVANVIVVDSASSDSTPAIAAKYSREVVQFKWNGHFPKKRNWILQNYNFKTPWVMFMDADERLTPAFAQELDSKLPSTRANAFICFYNNYFLDRLLRHGDAMRKTAVLRLGTGQYEKIDENAWSSLDMEIHEHLQVQGATGVISARLEHHDRRSLESYLAKHDQYAAWEAMRYKTLAGDFARLTSRQRLKYALLTKKWFGFAYFCASYFLKLGFLDGKPGFVFARLKWQYFSNIRRRILSLPPNPSPDAP